MAAASNELADYEWLVGAEAAEALALLGDAAPTPSLTTELRRRHSPDRVHLLLKQADLRRRARAKFPEAGRMFFTRVGLEQATDAWVAGYKAKRFGRGVNVADLCCGIGGDLLAIGQRAVGVCGVDRCDVTRLLAAANAQATGISGADFASISAEETSVESFDAWHADPDRRPTGRRSTRVELHSPNAEQLDELRRRQPSAAIKLAPGGGVPDRWAGEAQLEWISRGGEAKQLVAWFGSLATAPCQRTATALANDGSVLGAVTGSPADAAPIADALGEYLYEPDAAVFAAGLDGLLAERFGLCRLSRESGYLTSDTRIDTPLLTGFRIEATLPPRPRPIAAYMREHNVGRLEIKQRGAGADLDRLRSQLKPTGHEAATLILTRSKKKIVALVASRV